MHVILDFFFQYLDMNFSAMSLKAHHNFGHQDHLNGFVSHAHLLWWEGCSDKTMQAGRQAKIRKWIEWKNESSTRWFNM